MGNPKLADGRNSSTIPPLRLGSRGNENMVWIQPWSASGHCSGGLPGEFCSVRRRHRGQSDGGKDCFRPCPEGCPTPSRPRRFTPSSLHRGPSGGPPGRGRGSVQSASLGRNRGDLHREARRSCRPSNALNRTALATRPGLSAHPPWWTARAKTGGCICEPLKNSDHSACPAQGGCIPSKSQLSPGGQTFGSAAPDEVQIFIQEAASLGRPSSGDPGAPEQPPLDDLG